jgi:hypothetical protein
MTGVIGAYARVSDGIVYILEHDQGRYQTVRVDRDEEGEHTYLEWQLVPWTPVPGERVVESGEDDCTGVILETGEGNSLVRWAGFIEPQIWRHTQLEPAWS